MRTHFQVLMLVVVALATYAEAKNKTTYGSNFVITSGPGSHQVNIYIKKNITITNFLQSVRRLNEYCFNEKDFLQCQTHLLQLTNDFYVLVKDALALAEYIYQNVYPNEFASNNTLNQIRSKRDTKKEVVKKAFDKVKQLFANPEYEKEAYQLFDEINKRDGPLPLTQQSFNMLLIFGKYFSKLSDSDLVYADQQFQKIVSQLNDEDKALVAQIKNSLKKNSVSEEEIKKSLDYISNRLNIPLFETQDIVQVFRLLQELLGGISKQVSDEELKEIERKIIELLSKGKNKEVVDIYKKKFEQYQPKNEAEKKVIEELKKYGIDQVDEKRFQKAKALFQEIEKVEGDAISQLKIVKFLRKISKSENISLQMLKDALKIILA